ncbi:DNA-directed RNA polymerase subunit beta [Rickettsia endosymbiont of Cardiosporidium cionae]|uniref:DNA-directed RNA polymerase subunit beta n=1 Tax=Rickettsia endosymbiont of Cardiosporidium cionae TaxID=2777155 RepID=UPI001894D96F|nr:DNA-directed RNA polymerase subunit beta [Rickettsia endosymbiont of Cardiosporidium cionae]KAF8818631.1 DNA-directed RNA polymerase subunit beta [Rickettsia endosymbiont of Cardiosporidium cionae]
MNDKSKFVPRIRKDFSKIRVITDVPNLIEVQRESYEENFLQLKIAESQRKNKGLQAVLSSMFPIKDSGNNIILEFVRYIIEDAKNDIDECRKSSASYVAALKILVNLVIMENNLDTGVREIKGIKEQEVYLGDIPLMTPNSSFIINGIDRVIVSQMHRSPGVFFYHDDGKSHASGKFLYSARIIPYRGAWLDLEFDAKDCIFFRIDKKRKIPITSLLMALGMSSTDIISAFYDSNTYYLNDKNEWVTDFLHTGFTSQRLSYDLVNADNMEVVLSAGQKITPRLAKKFADLGLKRFIVSKDLIYSKYSAQDIIDAKTGEVIIKIGTQLNENLLELIESNNLKEFSVLNYPVYSDAYIRHSLLSDKNYNQESALVDIFKILRPGEPVSNDLAKNLFKNLFFNPDRYDLSEVGRIKINARIGLNIDISNTCLTLDDIKHTIKYLIDIKDARGYVDDIDHLGNRRVRSVGELIENQFRIGLVRVEKAVIERMSMLDVATVMPNELINSKLLTSVIKEFFNTSQLSQFMDQTNPLSEITHKRRLSALGPGGVSRDRVGFEVRDVHPTHYGRICPIETPEGQNIGLINSIAIYARINKYGFIESPYRSVKQGVVSDNIVYLSAIDESKYKIAQSDISINEDNVITEDVVRCYTDSGNLVICKPGEVDYIDLTPMQVVSVAASLIPFLENDDANRALMGSNMQRQAVPLVTTEAPIVGTGIESSVARDSGSAIVALNDGVIEFVDSTRIVLRADEYDEYGTPRVYIHQLLTFQKSNHNTCVHHKPIVSSGEYVKKGTVIADGPAIDQGEIALGRNVLVAFISWYGYNFEDSIVVSEKVVQDDVFTSIHIQEFEVVARDTRLGPEEITRDMPNVSEEYLRHLDEVGIVRIGAKVKSGDILVGKVTPKTESAITAEEKLLRAIFGEKAADVKDSSLYVPPGVTGTVVEVRIFSRRGIEKDERALTIEKQEIEKLLKNQHDEIKIIESFILIRIKQLLVNQISSSNTHYTDIGKVISSESLKSLTLSQCCDISIADTSVMDQIHSIKKHYDNSINSLNNKIDAKIKKIQIGDNIAQGALKIVKVFIASKYKLQPGDKMAGRHGNKGVVSKVVPVEDMPFTEDGEVIDVILNPLGIPSRMNIGQILETHLGWAGKNFAKSIQEKLDLYYHNRYDIESIRQFVYNIYSKDVELEKLKTLGDEEFLSFCQSIKKSVFFATPVFDGAKIQNIKDMLELANQDLSGQVKLIDGRTGDLFDRNITLGYKYLLKLHHLVDDKIHSRSTGPYSLVTQQPLGGKSHFGGQRFGEMECWALQAYGAAYTLQEMLTIKSDDVIGRIKTYETMVKGHKNFESSIPESFNVMMKEFRSLCLNIQLEESNGSSTDQSEN